MWASGTAEGLGLVIWDVARVVDCYRSATLEVDDVVVQDDGRGACS